MGDYKAFITGSRMYGIPHENSDIDLVILTTPSRVQKLVELSDDPKTEREQLDYMDHQGSVSVKFGRLNLLCCVNQQAFDCWLKGTKELKRLAPVGRQYAIDHFRTLRKKMKIT